MPKQARLAENIASLYGLQIFNYVIPLLTLPYLARVLGVKNWGALAIADAYGLYITLTIEYGFGLSATRSIANYRDDVLNRGRTVAEVVSAQSVLALVALAGAAALGFANPVFYGNKPLLIIACVMALLRGMTPNWYFQGLERMRVVAIIGLAANAAAGAGVFLLVRRPDEVWIPFALRAGAAFLGLSAGFFLIARETPLRQPSWRSVPGTLREGGSTFLFRSAVSMYTTANVLILSFFGSPAHVAWYAGAEKIIKVAVTAWQPITQSFYPRISYLVQSNREQATQLFRKSGVLLMSVAICCGATLFAFAPLVIRVCLGDGFGRSVIVLRIMSLLIPMVGANTALSLHWMLPLKLENLCNRIVLIAGLLNVALALVLARHYQEIGMAAGVVIVEAFILGALLVTLKVRGIQPWGTKAVLGKSPQDSGPREPLPEELVSSF